MLCCTDNANGATKRSERRDAVPRSFWRGDDCVAQRRLGINPIILKAALAELGPFALSGARCAIGCLCIVIYATVTKRAIFRIDGTEAIGALLGLLFVAQFAALFEAVRWTTLSHSIVFLYVAPLLVALGTTFLLKNEHLRPLQWIGLGLAFFGVASEFIGRWGVAHPAGDAMALLAALLWTSSTLLIKGTKLARIEPTKTLLYQIGVASIICPVAMWALGERVPQNLSPSGYVALIWQGAGIVGVTYALWIWLLGRYPAAQLSAFGFVTPLVGVAAAAVVLRRDAERRPRHGGGAGHGRPDSGRVASPARGFSSATTLKAPTN